MHHHPEERTVVGCKDKPWPVRQAPRAEEDRKGLMGEMEPFRVRVHNRGVGEGMPLQLSSWCQSEATLFLNIASHLQISNFWNRSGAPTNIKTSPCGNQESTGIGLSQRVKAKHQQTCEKCHTSRAAQVPEKWLCHTHCWPEGTGTGPTAQPPHRRTCAWQCPRVH